MFRKLTFCVMKSNIVVGVDPIHSLRKFFIRSMGGKRAIGKEDLRIETEDI